MIGVIYGGNSLEHDVSIKSAHDILSYCQGIDIYLTKDHQWIVNKKIVKDVIPILKKCKVIFPIIHGGCGEDGTLQGFLEMNQIPYIGCSVSSSALCMDKDLTKRILSSHDIDTSPFQTLTSTDQISVDEISFPCVVKASSLGSSFGVYIAEDKNMFKQSLEKAFTLSKKVLIEKFIAGREMWCSVLEKNNQLVVSDPCEIINQQAFFSYEDKYSNKSATTYAFPAPNTPTNSIKEIIKKTFTSLGCSDFARVDFFLTNQNKVIINEINTHPGFSKKSLFPKALMLHQFSYGDIINTITEKYTSESHLCNRSLATN